MATQTRKRRINHELVAVLYTQGYSLEDLAIIFKQDNGKPTHKSVISTIIAGERERTGNVYIRGSVRVPPKSMNQKLINALADEGIFLDIVDYYDTNYLNKLSKNTRFKKSFKNMTPAEQKMFKVGKNLYILKHKGANLKRVCDNYNIAEKYGARSLAYFEKHKP